MTERNSNGARYGATSSGRMQRNAVPRHASRRTSTADRNHTIQPARPYDPSAAAAAYRDPKRGTRGRNNRARRNRRRSSVAPAFIALGFIAVMVGVGAFLFFNPLSYKITINGEEHTVSRNVTIGGIIKDGLVTPVAGNLLAVDGSVITTGGGEPFAATVNGVSTTDENFVLAKDDVVDVANGADVTENYSSIEEAIPHGQHESDTSMYGYWDGSMHVYMKGEDGLRSTKTGEVSGITVTEDVKPAVDSGYVIYTANVGEDKAIALTFDDGPWGETTDDILDILQENGAKATFFTIGNQISDHAAQVKRAHDMGCEICTHTWDHAAAGSGVNLTYMSSEAQIEDVTKGMKAISDVIGVEAPRVMRAPGGNFYGDIISTLEPYLDAEIGWDVDTEDWRRPGVDAIYEMIMSVKPGQVVLMHDGGGDRTQTVEAVRQAVPALISQGYKLVTVSDLLAYGVPASA